MKKNFTETVYRIWDEDGFRIEVGDDPDSLGLIQIARFDSEFKQENSFIMTVDEAEKLANLLRRKITDLNSEEATDA